MAVFMTGATGYIGSVLLQQLLDEGETVHVLYRPSSFDKVDLSRSRIRPFRGDLLDVASLQRAMRDCNQVYHMAAYARVWAEDPSAFYRVNVQGTRNVLETAQKLQVRKVVLTSSAATLPASSDGRPVDESATDPEFETEYARTKHQAEEEAIGFNEKGLPTVIVNPPRVYGPGLMSESNAVTRLVKWYLEGKWRFLPGDGDVVGNYVYVEDVAGGHRRAMEHGRPGERYILGGDNVSLRELLHLVGEVSRKHRRMISIPVPLVMGIARFEMWKADLLGRSPLITPQWVKNYLKDSPLSSEKARQELGYTPIPLREGLRRTVDWLRREFPHLPHV
ncbi:MAG: SDR family oxidoreductase [Balneolaceae bacterium]|nr:SDR family oxidoreductase [Balneolaceae bacterium]